MADVIKVPAEGQNLINDTFEGALAADLKLRLFKSNTTPTESTVFADLTEANFSGYAASTPGYGASSTVAGKGKMVGATRNFTHNGGGTANDVYGYYVSHEPGGGPNTLLKVVRFDPAPQVVDSTGDQITVTDNWTTDSET